MRENLLRFQDEPKKTFHMLLDKKRKAGNPLDEGKVSKASI